MLPSDAKERAESFNRLGAERKAQIVSHLEALPAKQQAETVNQILVAGGEDAEFLVHILAKDMPAKGESPDNKQFSAIHTK